MTISVEVSLAKRSAELENFERGKVLQVLEVLEVSKVSEVSRFWRFWRGIVKPTSRITYTNQKM